MTCCPECTSNDILVTELDIDCLECGAVSSVQGNDGYDSSINVFGDEKGVIEWIIFSLFLMLTFFVYVTN